MSTSLHETASPVAKTQREDHGLETSEADRQLHPVADPLFQLQAAAAESPAARNLTALQRKANARGISLAPPRAPMRSGTQALPRRPIQRNRTAGAMASSRFALAAAQSSSIAHDPSLIPVPNSTDIALQRISTSAQEPMPGTPANVASPFLDTLGISATTMSNAEYKRWSDTIQCKMGMHGKMQVGNQTIVTQFKPNADVVQRVSFFQKHKAKFSAGLVMFEAGLTIAAAIVGLSAATSVGALNLMISAVVGAVVGVAKFIRGMMMMRQAFQSQDEKSQSTTIMIEAIRLTEAVGAAVALGFAAPGAVSIIAGTLFALSKGLRSLLAVYTDEIDEEIAELKKRDEEGNGDAIAALTKKKERAQVIATVFHAIEAVAIFVGGAVTLEAGLSAVSETGSTAMDSAKVIGGPLAMGVAASKGARAAMGYPAKKKESDDEPDVVSPDDPIAAASEPDDEGPALPETTR